MKKYNKFLTVPMFGCQWTIDCSLREVQKIEYGMENSTLHINGYDSSDRLSFDRPIRRVNYNRNGELIAIEYGNSRMHYLKSNLSPSDSGMLHNMMVYKLI
jgi:hypothetical protein